MWMRTHIHTYTHTMWWYVIFHFLYGGGGSLGLHKAHCTAEGSRRKGPRRWPPPCTGLAMGQSPLGRGDTEHMLQCRLVTNSCWGGVSFWNTKGEIFLQLVCFGTFAWEGLCMFHEVGNYTVYPFCVILSFGWCHTLGYLDNTQGTITTKW